MEPRRHLTVILATASLLLSNLSFADEDKITASTEPANTSAEKNNRDRALEANTEAAELAAEAILADTRLDIDIRLIGPTSVKIAGDR